ncbi:hypothetical protein ACQEU3_11010 [Spirillospora sp. CA-253888]
MAVHILRNRRRAATAAEADTKVAPAAPAPAPTVVERRPRRWRRSRPNPVSMALLGAGWAAALILVLGMLLTWGGANPGNTIVDATLDAGHWLATPFHDVFTRPDPDHQLYVNWSIAAVVYYLLGRVLSWLTRF